MHPRFQELSDFIRAQRAELRAAVDSVPQHLHDTIPADGRWSVSGVVEHLAKVEARVAALLRMKVDEARAAGVAAETETSPILAEVPIDQLLDRSRKLTAPDAVHPTGMTSAAALDALHSTEQTIQGILADADGIAGRDVTHTHAVFGQFNLYQWFAFVGAHQRRHAAQIREIGASLDGGV